MEAAVVVVGLWWCHLEGHLVIKWMYEELNVRRLRTIEVRLRRKAYICTYAVDRITKWIVIFGTTFLMLLFIFFSDGVACKGNRRYADLSDTAREHGHRRCRRRDEPGAPGEYRGRCATRGAPL